MREYFLEAETPFHIYNRGTEKRVIFTDYAEYCRFIFLMWVCRIGKPKINLSKNETIQAAEAILRGKEPNSGLYIKEYFPLIAFITWNLLPNHFHFVLLSLIEGGISKYMKKIGDAYTKYFNFRHQREGRLFQGPYQSIEIKNPKYFYRLIKYINLNQIELIEPQWKERRIQNWDKTKKFLDSHQWSAHQDFIGRRHSLLVDRRLVSKLFGESFTEQGLDNYKQFIEKWLVEDFEFIKKYTLENK